MSQLEHLTTALRDRYRVERELGRGGMATVYLAEDLKHNRQLAVKVLKPDLARSLGPERFLREIEIAARLHHPHVLPLYDSGKADGFLYYVMPYVEGESLRDRLNREKQLPVEDALVIAIEVADALGYAHSRDIIHRDIKPENIMLEADHALVADFGIARAISAAGEATITETGLAVGTPTYMSPEQAGGESQLDGRSDLYSLACVLYEMLAGQPPFTGPNISSVVTQHLSAEPPVVSNLRPGVPEEIAATLCATLAKTPADRPATARHFVESMTGPRPSRLSARISTVRAKRPWMLAGLAVGAVALGAVLATVLRGGGNGAEGTGTEREWVLVAEFEGSAGETHLKMGHSLVGTVLDQSRLVTTLPSDQVRRGLVLAGQPDTTVITTDVARELAVRGSIGAVVTGQIDRAGSTYSVLLRVVNAEDGSILSAVNGLAVGDDKLIPVTDSLARALRESLGERADQIRTDRPLVEVATPSFEAYQKFVQARELNANLNRTGARRLAREAIAEDPDFAAAYRLVGYTFYNVGLTDSARVAFEEARRRPERLTNQELLELEAFTAMVLDGDAERALGLYDRLLDLNPNRPDAYTRKGAALFLLGRFEEALDEFHRAAEISAFPLLNLSNMFGTLLNLRRVAEADSIWRMMEGETWRNAAIELALAREDWAGAERMADDIYNDPATPGYMAMSLGMWLSSALSVQGSINAADTVLAVSRERAIAAGAAGDAAILDQTRWLLALASEGSVGDPSDLTWAEGGDDPDLAAGARHVVRREWQEVVTLLGSRAAAGQVTGIPGTVLERWLVASAYERLGQPDSAVHYFELVVDPPRVDWLDRFRHGVTFAFGHRKLAALYDAMGRADDAARHRAIVDSRPTPSTSER